MITQNTNQREQLLKENLPFVRQIVGEIKKKLPGSVEYRELEDYGVLGLMESAQRFNPERGFQFSTFSHYRIKGAILDGLRKMSWLTPSAMRQQKEEFQEEEDVDVWAEPGVHILPLEEAPEWVFESREISPEKKLIKEEEMSHLKTMLKKLSPREQKMIHLHYYTGLNLKEAGRVIGISKSRASRIHKQALRKLRENFKNSIPRE